MPFSTSIYFSSNVLFSFWTFLNYASNIKHSCIAHVLKSSSFLPSLETGSITTANKCQKNNIACSHFHNQSILLSASGDDSIQGKMSWRKETWKTNKLSERDVLLCFNKQKQQLQVCWNTRFENPHGSKMFPCWFCADVNCCRKNISTRACNINLFTVLYSMFQ